MKKFITISLSIFLIFFVSTASYSQSHKLADQYYINSLTLLDDLHHEGFRLNQLFIVISNGGGFTCQIDSSHCSI